MEARASAESLAREAGIFKAPVLSLSAHIRGGACGSNDTEAAPREIQFRDTRLMRYDEATKRERDTSILRSTARYLERELDDDDESPMSLGSELFSSAATETRETGLLRRNNIDEVSRCSAADSSRRFMAGLTHTPRISHRERILNRPRYGSATADKSRARATGNYFANCGATVSRIHYGRARARTRGKKRYRATNGLIAIRAVACEKC